MPDLSETRCPFCARCELRPMLGLDGALCAGCGTVSSNAEIARGRNWTPEELAQWGAVNA